MHVGWQPAQSRRGACWRQHRTKPRHTSLKSNHYTGLARCSYQTIRANTHCAGEQAHAHREARVRTTAHGTYIQPASSTARTSSGISPSPVNPSCMLTVAAVPQSYTEHYTRRKRRGEPRVRAQAGKGRVSAPSWRRARGHFATGNNICCLHSFAATRTRGVQCALHHGSAAPQRLLRANHAVYHAVPHDF